MGQQQLLLLVLGIVIVGIAVVAGIQAFQEGKTKAEQDAAVSDAMRIVSDVQAWKLKPTAFGGGDDGTTAFTDVSLSALGYPSSEANPDQYNTINGCYDLQGGATATLKVYGETNGQVADNTETTDVDESLTSGQCDAETLIATVTISGTGTDSGSISWLYEE